MDDAVATRREIFVGGLLVLVRAPLIAVTGSLIVIRPRLIRVARRLVGIRPRVIPVGTAGTARELSAARRTTGDPSQLAAGRAPHNPLHRLPFAWAELA